MKFETPIMNISKFEVENVVTTSADPNAEKIAATKSFITNKVNTVKTANAIIDFSF